MYCALRHSQTERYFRRFLCAASDNSINPVSVTERAFLDWERAGNVPDDFAEFCLLCQPVSEALMLQKRCIFHAFAIRYNGRAFLLAGGSGAGKTTHGKYLLEHYSEEFSVINGDKPVLEDRDDGKMVVHPSPWTGKEGLRGADPAELRGIIYLSRAEKNEVTEPSENETALLLFPMIFQSFETEDIIRKTGAFSEKVVHAAPCRHLFCRDIKESSELLYQVIKEASADDI